MKQDLSTYKGERVRIKFRGVTGSSWCGDICVDDFMIEDENVAISTNVKVPLVAGLQYQGSRINFQIPVSHADKPVAITLYNIQGKMVRTLINGPMGSGYHSISLTNSLNKNPLASGYYVCRMKVGEFTRTINVILN